MHEKIDVKWDHVVVSTADDVCTIKFGNDHNSWPMDFEYDELAKLQKAINKAMKEMKK